MSYERLMKIRNGVVIDNCENCPNFNNPQGCTEKVCNEIKKNRLAELENKIESGLLVELPCKVGEKVYKVYGRCGGAHCAYNGDYGQWRCSYKGQTRCKPFIDEIPFALSDLQEVDKTIFTTKESAEAKLKELRGEE